MDCNGLRQYNDVPTTQLERDRSRANNHILDLVFANELDDVSISRTASATTSTHAALEITARLNIVEKQTLPERGNYSYKKTDWKHVITLLSTIFWAD